MGLPWTKVSQNKSFRAATTSLYGGPLLRVYPPGVFHASSTGGAPGQPPTQRIMPAKGTNQATDPRAGRGGFFTLDNGTLNISYLTPQNTLNVGGDSYGQSGNNGTSDYSVYLLGGILALLGYFVFLR